MKLKVRLHTSTVIRAFLGWHDLLVKFPDSSRYGFVGRGSLNAVTKLGHFENLSDKVPDHIFSVGRFCEFADCKIILSGEHKNSATINVVFGNMPGFVGCLRQSESDILSAEYPGFFEMGNAVVVGHGAILLGGHTLGDGVVVGAGCVVSKSIDAWSVVVGSPPKIKKREITSQTEPVFANWWEYGVDDIRCLLLNKQRDVVGKRKKFGEEPMVVVQLKQDQFGKLMIEEIIGFYNSGELLTFGSVDPYLKTYFGQMEKAFKSEIVELDSDILSRIK